VLSFLNAMLVKDCTAVLWGIGFDPFLGVLHRPQFGRPALALDLAEEFRPLIADSVVLNLVNNGEIKGHHFELRGRALALTEDGRRVVLRGYERRLAHELRHPRFGYTVSYRRTIEVQARILGAVMLEEINEYAPLVTR
jgi:CRISPR-associated protein Cas1